MNTKTNNNVKTDKEPPFLKIPFSMARKAKAEGVSFDQLMVYCWLYARNGYARSKGYDVYGKRVYDDLCKEISDDLGIRDVGDLCRKLEGKGWLQKSPAGEYNNVRMSGYLCLLSSSDRSKARYVEQEMHLADEDAVVEVEGTGGAYGERYGNGEGCHGGIRYYVDASGESYEVPLSAPPRPSSTAVWVSDPEGWYEPEDIPVNDKMEY